MGVALVAIGTALTIVLGAYLIMTVALSRRRSRPLGAAPPGELRWVFVVPALNEERVLANTLDSLTGVDSDRTLVVVVDDASDDATAAIARSYEGVVLLSRRRPAARQGKGAALNEAYRHIVAHAHDQQVPLDSVIIGIVDGDGRLAPDVVAHVGPYFADPGVGAVQIQVRITNRASGWLARFQDYEFLTFSSLTQSAREHLGSVGLGGNGQFTRLSALAELDDGAGPWGDCLAEDLDLGVRMALAGWTNRFAGGTEVRQQGLVSLRRVARQRTRWMQGHLQCWRHLPALYRSSLPSAAFLDISWYLLGPALCLVMSVVFGIATVLLATQVGLAVVSGDSVAVSAWVLLAYALSFGPAIGLAISYRRSAGDVSLARALVMAHLLWIYNHLWYLATWRALGRIVSGRSGWAKTARLVEAPT